MRTLCLVIALALSSLYGVTARMVTVTVAPQGRLEYDPPYVSQIRPGDTVVFSFQEGNHSVTQSEFDQPCVRLPVGSNTGFLPFLPGVRAEHGFTLYPEYDGSPRWFFCGNHCRQGMVFAINPDGNNLERYRAMAMRSGNSNPSPSPQPPPQQPQPTPPSPTVIPPATSPTAAPPTETPPTDAGGSSAPSTTRNPEGSPRPSGPAQTNSSPSSTSAATPRPNGLGSYEHIIDVGKDGLLVFSPSRVEALVGDIITFRFHSKGHSVTQSALESPCQPRVKEDGSIGFTSGLPSPTNSTSGQFHDFSIKVNDTNPIYTYCGQGEHCQAGMVFAVNVDSEGFNTFQQSARLGPRRDTADSGAECATPGLSGVGMTLVLVGAGLVLLSIS